MNTGVIAYHDNTWCAEPTLTTVALRNTLLGRMRVLDVTNTFYSDNVLSINANKRC